MKLLSKRTLRRLLRYLLMFFTIYIATQLIQECPINPSTSFIIATIAVIVFALLDIYFPLIVVVDEN